ncbi:MAG: FAD-binding protein, partial [Acidimicrobiia bacterium]|nr:FAD-binding protein [Acidimicrobiia bacterium]
SDHSPVLPDAVVFPATTSEVSGVVALANEHRIPVVGWGAGSSVEGHTIPIHRGITVDFRRMNRILNLYAEDFQAVVQPGILRLDLEDQLGRHGLFFPPDPGANASVGGMIANNAAGIRALRHGSASANVLGLEVVLADGTTIRTGSRSVKQSAGYDLTRLFVGSEGTLGLVTAATIRLAPIPEHFSAATIGFPDVASASKAVYGIMGHGLEPAALELLHQDHIRWMNEEDNAGLTVAPSLMIEYAGPTKDTVQTSMEMTREICAAQGSTGFTGADGRDARNAMWRLRHATRERMHRRFPGHHWIGMDVSVPVSRFPDLIAFSEEVCARRGFAGHVVGHAGDGNMHLGLHFDPAEARDAEAARLAAHEIVMKAIEMDGTCTGEHGVGLGKMKYMITEHGAEAVGVMWAIKRALDPNNILNPGKILPEVG